MRLLPRSLFSRLVLVLMAGLIVAQVLSLAIHAHERGRMLAQASGMHSARRMADIVNVLEPLPAAERRKLVGVLSAPPLLVGLDEPPQARPRTDADSRARALFFERLLRSHLGEQRELAVFVTSATPWKPFAHAHPGGRDARGDITPDGPGPHLADAPGLSFIASVRLRDGALVVFDTRQPAETLSWPYRLLGSVGILLAAVLALSLLAVRWLTRPLATLAEAAEQLGANIYRPPLEEKGPAEVQRAARAFNTMQAKLIGYLRERTRILAAMSHDLKTPITRLRLRAELLPDAELRSRFDHDLAEMESMVSRTLDFMRGVDSEERAQPIDIDALVQSLQRDAVEAGHDVTLSGSARAPFMGKPQALKRCLSNLLDNAVKYGERASITIDDGEERLVMRVSDAGPGIPAGDLERVFEPFYRLEPSRNRNTGGTGLGLSIARSIAEAHRGKLTLGNRPEGGLDALLELPRRQAAG